MTPLLQALTRFEQTLLDYNPQVGCLLNLPINLNELDPNLRSGFSHLPEHLRALYHWHNGTRWTDDVTLGRANLIPGRVFLPFDEANQEFEELANAELEFLDSMFPVATDGAGGFLLYQINSPFRVFDYSEGHAVCLYNSLEDFVNSSIYFYNEGAFYRDKYDNLEIDLRKYVRFGSALNPECDGWRIYEKNLSLWESSQE